MNRATRRAAARTERRSAHTKVTALGSAAVLASAGAGAAVVLSSAPAGANAPIVVTSLSDIGAPGTLRWAIEQANTDPGQDQITFSVTGTITLLGDLPHITDAVHINGPGPSSLTIDGADTYRVLLFDRVYSTSGDNEVTGLTITHGNAASNPNGGGGAIQVFYGTADMLIQDVVLHDNAAYDGGAIELYYVESEVTISGATITGNVASHQGGGLYIWGGGYGGDETALHVTITDSEISDNTAQCTAMSYNGGGGGIYVGNATLDVAGTTISNNTVENALCGGGGIHSAESVVTVTDSVISDNTAANTGGGLYSYNADATVVRTTISGNDATGDGGGGVATFGTGSFALTNSTVSDNTGFYYGGGLYLLGESSVIVQSTISGNSSSQAGGIYVGDSAGTAILLSTITGNDATAPSVLPAVDGIQVGGGLAPASARRAHREARVATEGRKARVRPTDDPVPAGTIQLIGAIVAGNGDLDVGGYDSERVTVDSIGSIIGAVQADIVTVADLGGTQTGVTAAALKLGPLADNGGPTQTHALLAGSVAIDAGPAATALPEFDGSAFDQRGEPYTRISNGVVDVGAYEVQVPAPEPEPEPTFTG